MIPPLTSEGLLPPGLHLATWDEFEEAFLWNPRRRGLARGLKEALTDLALAGCGRAYVDGSFVTAKEWPNDWDGCWEPAGVDVQVLDRVLLEFEDGRRAQKAKYGGEMFLANIRRHRRWRRLPGLLPADKGRPAQRDSWL